MQFDKHGNGRGLDDLFVLPESEAELTALVKYLKESGRSFEWVYSDVDGSDWEGKQFLVIPFGEVLKQDIKQFCEKGGN